MKKLFVILLLITITDKVTANDKFEEAMLKNMKMVYTAESIEQYQQAINGFARIASAVSDRWEPHYYMGYAYVLTAFKENDSNKKDKFLDLAQEHLEKAKELTPDKSEIATLQGFIYTGKLTVDPMTRGPQYSGLAMQVLNEALQLNPDNPRALLLLGQMMYGTAEFMGTGTEKACQTIAKSIEKFQEFKPATPVAPDWGEEMASGAYQRCDQ